MLIASATALGHAQNLKVWTEDPLTKVFKDTVPNDKGIRTTEVARGEQAEWQLAIQASGEVTDLKVNVGTFHSSDSSLRKPRVRYVSFVHVDKSMAQPAKDLLRPAPADYPDPLILESPTHLPAMVTQPIWIDCPVPLDAKAGDYEAQVRIKATVGGALVRISMPIHLKVFNVMVGASRLWVTNWFFTSTGHMPGSNSPGTKEEDAYLKLLAKSMKSHRQNVALINTLDLAKISLDAQGKMTVDFSRFDEWVKIFKDAGVIGRIEGGHLGGRVSEAWESQFGINIKALEGGKWVTKQVSPTSPEAESFYSQYLPLLTAHLKAKGWTDRYMQHIADEPIDANKDTYRAMGALVHKYAPSLKVIEATHTKSLAGELAVWVPQLNFAHDNYDFYKSRQKTGEEFWTYTCVWPEGEYANRFIELPLIKTRLLHWINFRYGITGYLHWGFNYWVKDDPFTDVTRTKAKDGWGGFLPAGDSWIVYPKEGALIDSIRYETMRDGIADYELLSMLAEKNPMKAQRLAETMILAFDRYVTDVEKFRAVRKDLLSALSD